MPRDQNRERIILGRVAGGESYASIARDFGVTRERIRQIVARNRAPIQASKGSDTAESAARGVS